MTEGFRGIYEVGEQARPYGPAIFDVMYDRPPMLVPQSLTGEVRERIDFRGRGAAAARRRCTAGDHSRACGARSLNRSRSACCSRFSIPSTSSASRAIARRGTSGCSVSLSSDVLPQIREYYRLSTTVINAYLQPLLARYIASLDRRLAAAGVATPQKYIMQSNGGMSNFAAAARKAVTTVLSGPRAA